MHIRLLYRQPNGGVWRRCGGSRQTRQVGTGKQFCRRRRSPPPRRARRRSQSPPFRRRVPPEKGSLKKRQSSTAKLRSQSPVSTSSAVPPPITVFASETLWPASISVPTPLVQNRVAKSVHHARVALIKQR
eukprot:873536_1